MKPEHISLYFCEGTSNKEYHAHLVEEKGQWAVNVEYGRRGQTLKSESKTKAPVSYEVAKEAYDKVVKEKTRKGYSVSEEGSVFQSPSMEERFTGILPQLLNTVEEVQLLKLMDDDSYCMQEKHNGERRIVKKDADAVTGVNKKGLEVALPKVIEEHALDVKAKQFVLDNEIIGNKIYPFDLLELNGKDLREKPYQERLALLNKHVASSSNIIQNYTAFTKEEKIALLEKVRNAKGEGVVFKKIDAHYSAGRPASGGSQLKFKFLASATLLVESNHATKRSVGVVAFDDNGAKVALGNVTIYPDFEIPAVGSIVEVEYLYAYKNGSIYQAVYQGVRNDQDLSDCTTKQLKYKPEDELEEKPASKKKVKI